MNGNENGSINNALQVLDAFMESFNKRDIKAHFESLNFPHIRIAGGEVSIWNNVEEMIKSYQSEVGRRVEPNWNHSTFDSKEVIHSSKDKVHFAVQFTRYDKDDKKIATYKAVYVVTCINGRWGIQARSSFAP